MVTVEQIPDTIIDRADKSILQASKIAEIIQAETQPTKKNEKAFAQSVRSIEEPCKLDDRFSLLDFNIKSNSR